MTRHFRYTPTGYRAYYTVRKLVSRCLGGKILSSAPPPYKEDLAENLRKFAMDKVACNPVLHVTLPTLLTRAHTRC